MIYIHDLVHGDTGGNTGIQGLQGITGGYNGLPNNYVVRYFILFFFHNNKCCRNFKFMTKMMDFLLWRKANFVVFLNLFFCCLKRLIFYQRH